MGDACGDLPGALDLARKLARPSRRLGEPSAPLYLGDGSARRPSARHPSAAPPPARFADARAAKAELARRTEAGDQTFSHFSMEANELAELEAQFKAFGQTGRARTRTYVHDDGDVIEVTPDTAAFFPQDWKGVCTVHETVKKVYMIR